MELACGCKYDEKIGNGVVCAKHVPQKWKDELVERNKSDCINDLMRAYNKPDKYTAEEYVELLEELICFVAGIPRRDIMD